MCFISVASNFHTLLAPRRLVPIVVASQNRPESPGSAILGIIKRGEYESQLYRWEILKIVHVRRLKATIDI